MLSKKFNSPAPAYSLAQQKEPLKNLSIVQSVEVVPNELESLQYSLEGALLELSVQDSELRLYKKELAGVRSDNLKFKEAFESAPIGYFKLDAFMQIIEVNAAGARMLEKRRRQVNNTLFSAYLPDDEIEIVGAHVNSIIAGDSGKVKTRMLCGSGKTVSVTLFSHPVQAAGETGFYCQMAMMDISEYSAVEAQLRKARDYLQHAANHDTLTKLPNRMYFNDQLSASLKRARRTGSKVAVIVMDLDRFKNVNDSLGHHIGDELLIEVASRLKQATRDFDTVARLGGDEFTVILERITNTAEVSEIAAVIGRELARPFTTGSHEVCTAASMGVCLYPTDSLDIDELVRFADAAMYRAKSLGRNKIQFFTSDLNAELLRRFTLENDLRQALREDQFELYFQPQYDCREQKVVGLEALLRWHHPTRGLLTPDEFIDIAEETGVIEPLGDWILQEALESLGRLHALGHDTLTISVNLSPRQFSQPMLYQTIMGILDATNTSPEHLDLELTESALLEDPGNSIETLNSLRQAGVQLSIDDFGTGYSSFSRLRRLPISRIKIDKSFVSGLPHSQDDRAITKAIVSMAHDLGLEVVSEGVENKAQVEFLQNIHCDVLQGYFVGKPMCFEKISQSIGSRSIQ